MEIGTSPRDASRRLRFRNGHYTMNATTPLPADFTLECDAWGQLVLTCADGRRFVGVEVVRAFPISGAGRVRVDLRRRGARIDCASTIQARCRRELRRILEEELAGREFMPRRAAHQAVLADADPSQWRIVTDRGPTTFLMEDSDNDVRRLGANRILLVDVHGIRYLIPDTRRLDAASRRILERYL